MWVKGSILAGCAQTQDVEDTQPFSTGAWVLPPFVFVNDALYKHHIATTPEALGSDYTYLGTICSLVPSHESPTENFQANREHLLNSEVYRSMNYLIVVHGRVYDYYYLESDYDNHFLNN